ncbi:MAG: N-acetylmuramoyl-L-alanine amidase [Nitratireductor sp.]
MSDGVSDAKNEVFALLESANTNCKCEVQAGVNINDRKGVSAPDMLVLHYTGMPSGDQALNWLCVEESQVSCHYLVHEDGRIVQMVDEKMRAWHAGVSSWRGFEDINSRSIGIEIVNPGHDHGYPDFPQVQIDAVIDLCKDILVRNEIEPRNVVAHSDIAPMRKLDPGEKFPWDELASHGIGHYVEPSTLSDGRFLSVGESGQPVAALQSMLALYGYGVVPTGEYDALTQSCVKAFQMHYRRTNIDGVADGATIDTLYRLIKALD